MVFGIDEVGRGSWAGPLVFSAVGIDLSVNYDFVAELRDSKQLSKNRLQQLNIIIRDNLYFDITVIEPSFIDKYGLTLASIKACETLAQNITSKYPNPNITIDGNINYLGSTQFVKFSSCMIKADSLVTEVMSASIVAKVYRDQVMTEYAAQYPGYYFDKNVGYGTKEHIEAIRQLGTTPIHRLSYKPLRTLNNV